jgi:hypothetical protein
VGSARRQAEEVGFDAACRFSPENLILRRVQMAIGTVRLREPFRIADESPEAAANSIVALLMREAAEMGMRCEPVREQKGIWIDLTVWVGAFCLNLRYVESQNISIVNLPLGRGFINREWELVLPPTNLFQWQLYRCDPDHPGVPHYDRDLPEHFLDADLLRKLLRQKLGHQQPASP